MDKKTMAAVRKWTRGKRRQYKVYEQCDGYNPKLVEDAAWQVMDTGDFEADQHGFPVLTDIGEDRLNSVFAALYPATWLDHATDGGKWSDAIGAVADRLGLTPEEDDDDDEG